MEKMFKWISNDNYSWPAKKDHQFNQDIWNWNVSNVTNTNWMFAYSRFNRNLSSWNLHSTINFDEWWASRESRSYTDEISIWSWREDRRPQTIAIIYDISCWWNIWYWYWYNYAYWYWHKVWTLSYCVPPQS